MQLRFRAILPPLALLIPLQGLTAAEPAYPILQDAGESADESAQRGKLRPKAKQKKQDRQQGAAGWLGVYIEQGDRGVRIQGLVENSPAEASPLEAGDVIISINEKEVHGIDELTEIIASQRAGKKVTVTVLREGMPLEYRVRLGERPPEITTGDRTQEAEIFIERADENNSDRGQARRRSRLQEEDFERVDRADEARRMSEDMRREVESIMQERDEMLRSMEEFRRRLGERMRELPEEVREEHGIGPGGSRWLRRSNRQDSDNDGNNEHEFIVERDDGNGVRVFRTRPGARLELFEERRDRGRDQRQEHDDDRMHQHQEHDDDRMHQRQEHDDDRMHQRQGRENEGDEIDRVMRHIEEELRNPSRSGVKVLRLHGNRRIILLND